MRTFTVTRVDRNGKPLTGAPTRRYQAADARSAGALYVAADGVDGAIYAGGDAGMFTFNPPADGSPVRVRVDADEPGRVRTYKVTLTAAQGGRHPHVFRVSADIAGDVYGAILVAYRERHPDARPINRRDIHSRGSNVGAYSVIGNAGAVTFADVEIIREDAPTGGTIVEIAEPRRPRLRLLLEGDARTTDGGYWTMYGRKGRLDGVFTQRFAARCVHREYVTIISSYDERREAAKRANAGA